ncbi:MAG: HRDC domain-containing protein, partial [Proteobacteria bacterium]|nr:HRDC domain-containing protein [Pseudomonadota bacterium]
YESLENRLKSNGRASWLDGEMAELTSTATYVVESEDAWLRLKPKTKNRRFLAIVQNVAGWREERAKEVDIPRNRVIRDDVVMEIAAHPPKTADDLRRIRGFSDGLAKGSAGESLLKAVQDALDLPEDALPDAQLRKNLPRGIGPVVDLLKVLLKMRCETENVAQKLVASASDLENLAADDNADIPALQGWRLDLFGKDALALKHGKLALSVRKNQIIVTPVD